jgi:1,4-dihydroxy-2-naphthoate octaprenyltransferase
LPKTRILTMISKHQLDDASEGRGAAYAGHTVLRQLSPRNLAQAARIQWSWSHTSSLLIGAAVAWKDGFFDPALLLLAWFCVEMIHAATCMTNDYWDYRSGADAVGEHTIFNAGSRVIQQGRMSPGLVVTLSCVCYMLGGLTGIYLAVTRGWPIALLGVAGVLLGYGYTAPPARLAYRGLDQLTVALCYGPLTILFGYYVQSRRFTPEMLLVSAVYAITASMILYVKGFQDTEFDRRARKESVVIKLGPERAASLFIYFFLAAYLLVGAGILLGILPLWMIAAAGSVPLALRARRALREHSAGGDARSFFTLLMRTKSVHLYLGFLLIAGYLLMGTLARLAR